MNRQAGSLTHFLKQALRPLLASALVLLSLTAHADPILTSWFTKNSTVLARVVQSGTLTNPVTTWPSAGVANNNTGGAAQTLPSYSDVQRIRNTASDVYVFPWPLLRRLRLPR